MRITGLAAILALIVSLAIVPLTNHPEADAMDASTKKTIDLPEPQHNSRTAIEQALLKRRSQRSYAEKRLTLKQISQLCWAAQGVTNPRGFRTAPSAGALYPLELFLAAANVEGLDPGVYRYQPENHRLVQQIRGDQTEALWQAGLHQSAIKQAPAVFVFTAVFERTMRKYDDRGKRYALMETGHAAQNLCLQAVALDLATVPMGAFDDSNVARTLGLDETTRPLYLLPVGHLKE